jgi:DNA-binding transcriptional regulator YdaS (Cro superfamily)
VLDIPGMSDSKEALRRAVDKLGLVGIARSLGISKQAVSQWEEVPPLRVLEVERLSGVPRHELRPDLYPAPAEVRA